jgi:GT2 family glycosyltransferase
VSAMNGLFRHVSGEIVFVVHPDIVLEDGCIERLLHFFASHQEAGIISPNMKFPNGDLTMIRISYPSIHSELRRLAGILLYICFKRDFFPKEALWDRASDKDVDMVMSVCLVMRRKVLDAIGEITPELKTYYSNDYLCMRARSLGWKVYYVRDAMVIHYEQFSPDNLYSVSNEMAYKKSAVPISYLLERDKFTFMKHLRSKTGLAVLKCITTIEYVVHALASIKKFRQISTPASRAYLSVIKEIWSV